MNWASLGDFVAMGGYGLYVWGSYLVTGALIAAEVVLLVLRKRKAVAYVRAGAGQGEVRA